MNTTSIVKIRSIHQSTLANSCDALREKVMACWYNGHFHAAYIHSGQLLETLKKGEWTADPLDMLYALEIPMIEEMHRVQGRVVRSNSLLAELHCKRNQFGTSFEYAKQAAEQNSANGQNLLAKLYWHGQGTSKNQDQAIDWMMKAARKGNPLHEFELASMMCQRGDFARALLPGLRSASKGNPNAKALLAQLYFDGHGIIPRDLKQATEWITKAAEHGPSYQFKAFIIFNSLGNESQAHHYLIQSAEGGLTEAQYTLATYLWHGNLMEKNQPAAIDWMIKAAQKSPENQFKLARMLHEVGRSAEACEWLKQSAGNGYPDAQVEIAKYAFSNRRHPINEELAVDWAIKAANQGNPKHQFALAWILNELGEFAEALPWLHESAKQGDCDALEMLAIYAWHGRGCEKSPDSANRRFEQILFQSDATLEQERRVAELSGDLLLEVHPRNGIVYALTRYLRAVKKGSITAIKKLSDAYAVNHPAVSKDTDFEGFRSAAEEGNCGLQAFLCSESCRSEDWDQARYWLKKLQENQNPDGLESYIKELADRIPALEPT